MFYIHEKEEGFINEQRSTGNSGVLSVPRCGTCGRRDLLPEEQEINRCVIEQWIDNKDENFYDSVTIILRNELKRNNKIVDNMGILKPYNFVLEDDDKEPIAELYLADDDTVIIGGDLMTGLDEDLDAFLDDLFKD